MFAIGSFPFCPKPTLPIAPEMGRVAWKSDLCLRGLLQAGLRSHQLVHGAGANDSCGAIPLKK